MEVKTHLGCSFNDRGGSIRAAAMAAIRQIVFVLASVTLQGKSHYDHDNETS